MQAESQVKNGALVSVAKPIPGVLRTSSAIWLFIIGFFTGIFVTLTVTILIGWIINTSVPHSSWLNKAFYGYALGCSSIAEGKDVTG